MDTFLVFLNKFKRKFRAQKTLKHDVEMFITESRARRIIEELVGTTEEELEMIRLRVLNEIVPANAAKPTDEETREFNDMLEFLTIKNQYLRMQPCKHTLSSGKVISTLVYIVD